MMLSKLLGRSENTKPQPLRKATWWVMIFITCIIVLCFFMFLTLPQLAVTLADGSINRSWLFLTIRYTGYAVLYWRWDSIILRLKPTTHPEVLKKSRQKLLILIVVYECVAGLNIIQWLFS